MKNEKILWKIKKIFKKLNILNSKIKEVCPRVQEIMNDNATLLKIHDEFKNMIKTRSDDMEEYFIDRIDFLTTKMGEKADIAEESTMIKYIEILEQNKVLKERILELEVKNKFYKDKIKTIHCNQKEGLDENVDPHN